MQRRNLPLRITDIMAPQQKGGVNEELRLELTLQLNKLMFCLPMVMPLRKLHISIQPMQKRLYKQPFFKPPKMLLCKQ